MRTHFPTMAAKKRFIYDLGAACGDLAVHAGFDLEDPIPQAWVVEHLRSYHYLEVDDLYPLTHRNDVRLIDERCPRLAETLTRTLYHLFRPMAFQAMEAWMTDMSFKRNILTVTLYQAA